MSEYAIFSARAAMAVVFAALVGAGPWAGARAQGTMHKPAPMGHKMGATNPKGPKFEPATVCKQCHAEIYRDWSQSMHAHAREAWYFAHKVGSERMGMSCFNEKKVAVACPTHPDRRC